MDSNDAQLTYHPTLLHGSTKHPLMATATPPKQLLTVGDWIRYATSRFAHASLHYGHGTDNPADEAFALVMQCLRLDFKPPAYVYEAALTDDETHALFGLIGRRIDERVPLPYLFGRAWFCGLEFEVDPRVLIPRSPIAQLIQDGFEPWAALEPGARILDMCAGSACIGIACAKWLDDVVVDAAEIDEGALDVARANVARHDVADRVTLIQSDLFSALGDQRYDLIIANPPYVGAPSMAALPAEFEHEPARALHAEQGGLALVHQLLANAAHHLTDDGVMLVEVGESADALVAAYPTLDILWCEFEHGGDGVFAVTAHTLRAASDLWPTSEACHVG